MRIQCSGQIVDDGDKWIYDWFEIPNVAPSDLRAAIGQLAEGEELVLEINSPGGMCYSGFEIYSVLRSCGHPTVAEVQGVAASAASIQSSAFCKNHPARSPVMSPNCRSETTR